MHPTEIVVRQFHESWDMRDPERGAEVIAEDCDFEDIARGEKLAGKEAYKADYYRWREAFPDGLCKVENVIISQCGEWATVEFRNTGIHSGILRSSLGDFPPTGRQAEVRYCSVMRVPQRQHSCILNPESPRGPVLEQLNATLFVRT